MFKKIVKNILKTVSMIFGYELKKICKPNDLILKNVFKTNFKKQVLISFLTGPFKGATIMSHSNYTECFTAAEIFKSLGYNVDVIDYQSNIEIVYNNYDIIYGQGLPFENSFLHKNSGKFMKILYGTGTSHYYYSKVCGKLVADFYREKKKLIPESARMNQSFSMVQFMSSDLIIALGNSYCKKTYTDNYPKLKCEHLNAFYFDVYDIDIAKKNFSIAKKNFLWFGSSGLLSKGLGLCIEIFSKRSDLTLHICGASKRESGFWEYYNPILDKSSNIIDYGFIDIQGQKFRDLMDSCTFAIYPSVSEGGSVALLNIMANGGLIPITTKGCSLDVEEFGYVVDDVIETLFEGAIEEALLLTETELYEKSLLAKQSIRKEYTIENYKNNLFKILAENIS